MRTWLPMTDENTKPPTGGTSNIRVEATPLGGGRVLYKTGAGEVEIQHANPDFTPTQGWLDSQRRQHMAATGRFSSLQNQERVAEVVASIRSFDYDRHATPVVLAKKWGVSVRYAKLLCTEAQKLVREELEDEDYAGSTILEALDRVIRTNSKNPKVANQALVVKAAKVYADIVGMRAPIDIRVSRGDDLPNDPVQLAKMAEELSKRLLESNDAPPTDYPTHGGEAVDPEER